MARRVMRRAGLEDLRARIEGETYLQNHARVFRRDIMPLLREIRPAKDAKKLLFWSPFAAWYHTLVEYFLATNLRLRGHEVTWGACNGEPTHCAMERDRFVRPACSDCFAHTSYLLQVYGLPSHRLQDHVGLAEQRAIRDQCLSLDDQALREFRYQDLPLGEHAIRFLITYFNGFVPYEEHRETARRILAGEWVATLYAERLVAKLKPDRVLMFSGNDAQHFGPFRRLLQLRVPVSTWDECAQWSDGFYFMHEACAGDVAIQSIWEKVADLPLTPKQETEVEGYLEEWRRGVVCGTRYHPSPDSDAVRLRERLRIPTDRPVLLALPNVVWDSNVVAKNVGFKDMREWIQVLLQWFVHHPEVVLVLRAHPAERKVALEKHFTRPDSTMAALVRAMYPNGLPDNVRMIPAEDDADTYVLGQLATCVCTYTSNIGLELVLRGKPTWVAGLAFYRGKGFTSDLQSADHLRKLLDLGNWGRPITAAEAARARRFLHFWVFRHAVRMPWHRRELDTYGYPFAKFRDFQFLRPGGDPQLDAIADRLIDGHPFVDLPWKTNAAWRIGSDDSWQSCP